MRSEAIACRPETPGTEVMVSPPVDAAAKARQGGVFFAMAADFAELAIALPLP